MVDSIAPGPRRTQRMPAPGGVSRSAAVVVTTCGAGAGAAVAAVIGLVSQPERTPFTTARGQTVDLFGGGIYRYDSLFSGAANRGTDAVTLVIVLPLLLLTCRSYRRGSLRATLMLTGAQAWLLYAYATMAMGAAFNPLFPLYVAVFSASLWALVLTMEGLDAARLAEAAPGLPRRGPAILMVLSGLVTAVIWWSPVLTAQTSGAVPGRLDDYTTLVTVALDTAVITPAALAAGILIWRRRAAGYRIAMPLLVLEALLLPMIAAQTISQLAAGIAFSPPEIIGPLAGFTVLAAAAGAVLFRLWRELGDREGSGGHATGGEDAQP